MIKEYAHLIGVAVSMQVEDRWIVDFVVDDVRRSYGAVQLSLVQPGQNDPFWVDAARVKK